MCNHIGVAVCQKKKNIIYQMEMTSKIWSWGHTLPPFSIENRSWALEQKKCENAWISLRVFLFCIVSIKTSVNNLEDSKYSVKSQCLPSSHEEFVITVFLSFHFEETIHWYLTFTFPHCGLRTSVTLIAYTDPPLLCFLGYTQMTVAISLTLLVLMAQIFGAV